MNGRPPEISLILSTFNQPFALDKILAALAEQSISPFEIIVADDGSDAETKAVVQKWVDLGLFPLRHVWQENKGFRKSRILNRAILETQKDYVVFLDGDCLPHRRFVEDHGLLAEKNHWVQGRRCFVDISAVPTFSPGFFTLGLGLLTGKISGFAKAFRLPWTLVRRNQSVEGILGCNLGIWKEDLLAVNGFDEAYEGWGKEDSDLGVRLYHLGRHRKLVHGKAILYHLNHPVISRRELSENAERLRETIRSGKVRCEQGLDRVKSGPESRA